MKRINIFKMIAILLINSFLMLDIAWAGAGELLVIKPAEMLSAPVQISQQQFSASFDQLYADKAPTVLNQNSSVEKTIKKKPLLKRIVLDFRQSSYMVRDLLTSVKNEIRKHKPSDSFLKGFQVITIIVLLMPAVIILAYFYSGVQYYLLEVISRVFEGKTMQEIGEILTTFAMGITSIYAVFYLFGELIVDSFNNFKSIIIPLVTIPPSIVLGWIGVEKSEEFESWQYYYIHFKAALLLDQIVYVVMGAVVLLLVGTFVYGCACWIALLFHILRKGFKKQEIKKMIRQKTGVSGLKVSKQQINKAKEMLEQYYDFAAHISSGVLFISPPKQNEPEQKVPGSQANEVLNNALVVNNENIPVDSKSLDKVKDLQQLKAIYVINQDGQKISVDELLSGIFLIRAI